MQKGNDVFISWTGNDAELKSAVAKRLDDEGIGVLLSDEKCQGNFVLWSRKAAVSASVFMPIVTEHSLKSEGMSWERDEIERKLASCDEADEWRCRILPICDSLELYYEYDGEHKLRDNSISAAILEYEDEAHTKLTEKCLKVICDKAADMIMSLYFDVYCTALRREYIKLVPYYKKIRNKKDINVDSGELYVNRCVTELDENGVAVMTHDSPRKLFDHGVSFIYGPAGCGKSGYVRQIYENAEPDELVIMLKCTDVAKDSTDILTLMRERIGHYCGVRRFFTDAAFTLMLGGKKLILVLDGMDEIATEAATRRLVRKVMDYYDVNSGQTSLIFTGRNESDFNLLGDRTKSAHKYRLNLLTDDEVRQLGHNLFLLFGSEEKENDFYVSVQSLDEEIRRNPLLLSQLAIVYDDGGSIPQSTAEILDAVFSITLAKDEEHDIVGVGNDALDVDFKKMVDTDLYDILKRFSQMRYVQMSLGKKVGFEKIMSRVLKDKYKKDNDVTKRYAELLKEYLQNRAIIVDDEFYHKMFLEYFTAVRYFEESYDEINEEIENTESIRGLFGHYGDANWDAVIKLYLVKADSVMDHEQTKEFYKAILDASDIEEYTLMFDTCRDLVNNKESAQTVLVSDILSKSVKGVYPAYGPLFWYVPEYGLYEAAFFAAEQQKDAKATALVRDVSFIFGGFNTVFEISRRVDGKKLFDDVKTELHGVRRALCELFCLGETEYTEADNIYPRCYNVKEAKSFMSIGQGVLGKMDEPFCDELGLYEHEAVNQLGGEYIGLISMLYDPAEIERVLAKRSSKKLRGLILTPTASTNMDYIAINRSHLDVVYIPENIETYDYYSHHWKDRLSLMRDVATFGEDKLYFIGEVTVPDCVTEICDKAFYGCVNLRKITIPDNIKKIGKWAFGICANLTAIEIPNGVSELAESAFMLCGKLTDVILPDSLDKIDRTVFYGCTSLERITIPEGVKTIEHKAFGYCDSLQEIVIPDSVESIGDWAFAYCPDLERAVIGGVEDMGLRVFESCTSLKSVTFSADVRDIHHSVFFLCPELCELTLPKRFSYLAHHLFETHEKLAEVSIVNDDLTVETLTPEMCEAVDPEVAEMLAESKRPQTVTIPDGETVIDDHLFGGNMALSDVTIPDSVTKIGVGAFNWCVKLSEITIPDGVTEIGKEAFLSCASLQRIKIPKGVTRIDRSTFKDCGDLYEVILPEGLLYIGYEAFDGCGSLESINLPDSIVEIGIGAFARCYSLKSIVIPNGVREIQFGTFTECSALTDIVIPDSVIRIRSEAFAGCSSLKSVTIPKDVTKIDVGTFIGCEGLVDALLPTGLQEIDVESFMDCSSLEHIDIPDGVTKIGFEAFRGCESLRSITIPDSVRIIDDGAFFDCTSLESVTIGLRFEGSIDRIFGDIDKSKIRFITSE